MPPNGGRALILRLAGGGSSSQVEGSSSQCQSMQIVYGAYQFVLFDVYGRQCPGGHRAKQGGSSSQARGVIEPSKGGHRANVNERRSKTMRNFWSFPTSIDPDEGGSSSQATEGSPPQLARWVHRLAQGRSMPSASPHGPCDDADLPRFTCLAGHLEKRGLERERSYSPEQSVER